MRILCIGDVVGSIGCEFLRNNLPTLKKVKGVDFVICNGENSAQVLNGLCFPILCVNVRIQRFYHKVIEKAADRAQPHGQD